MTRPARPWFRFYVEAVRDRKLRRRTPAHRWLWVVLLSMARASRRPGWILIGDSPAEVSDITDEAALRPAEVRSGLEQFLLEGMLVEESGVLMVAAWDARQFESDSSSERTAELRSRNGHVTPEPRSSDAGSDGFVAPPETEAETETEKRESGPRRRRPLTEVPDTFNLSDDQIEWVRAECPNLDPYAATQEWLTACKAKDFRYRDWEAAWKNAMRRATRWHKPEAARTHL